MFVVPSSGITDVLCWRVEMGPQHRAMCSTGISHDTDRLSPLERPTSPDNAQLPRPPLAMNHSSAPQSTAAISLRSWTRCTSQKVSPCLSIPRQSSSMSDVAVAFDQSLTVPQLRMIPCHENPRSWDQQTVNGQIMKSAEDASQGESESAASI